VQKKLFPIFQPRSLKKILHPFLVRESIAEGIGTFILIFMGTGAIMVNTLQDGAISHLGISLVFGMVVAALIYTIGHISQAHLNPAVTLAFWTSGVFPRYKVVAYITAQCVGAIAASGCLRLTLGNVAQMGATLPLKDDWLQSLILETILTFVLMFVIFGSGLDRRAPLGFAGIAIGLTVGLEAATMGPITGALVGGIWQHHWVYWLAPVVGAQLAMVVYRYLSDNFHDIT
jgi:MIP family channel proteins